MKTIGHIFAKDFRVLRLPWLIWLLVDGLQLLIGVTMVSGSAMTNWHFIELQMYQRVMWGAQMVLTVALTGWLALEDPVTSARAFWLTRPIAKGQVLGEKLLTGLSLLVVPAVMLAFPWWLACGLRGETLWRAVVICGGLQTVVVVLGLTIAAFCERWVQFCLVAFALTLAGLVLQFLFTAGTMPHWDSSLGVSYFFFLDILPPIQWCLLPLAVALLINRYLSRDPRQSWRVLGLGICCILTSVVGWTHWREQVWQRALSGAADSEDNARNVHRAIALDATTLLRRIGSNSRYPFAAYPINFMTADYSMPGAPTVVFFGSQSWTWHWADGTNVNGRGGYIQASNEEEAVLIELGLKEPSRSLSLSNTILLPPSIAERLRTQPAVWKVMLTGRFLRPHIALALPLVAGAVASDGQESLRVAHVLADRKNLGRVSTSLVRTRGPNSLSSAKDGENYPYASNFSYLTGYFVVSRYAGHAFAHREFSDGDMPGAELSGVRTAWGSVSWSQPPESNGTATLYKIEFREESAFSSVLSGDAFRFDKVKTEPRE